MAIQTMNQFRITRQNGGAVTTVCATMADAVNMFDTVDNPAVQAVRTAIGLEVIVPEQAVQVNFRTVIGGAGALSAGCQATPTEFTVNDGAMVIFEAIPAAGFSFLGWWIGEDAGSGAAISTELIASIPINSQITTSADVIVTAQFAPIAP